MLRSARFSTKIQGLIESFSRLSTKPKVTQDIANGLADIYARTQKTPVFNFNAETKTENYMIIIKAAKNNTHLHLDKDGRTVCHVSAGSCGLKKAQRGTSDAGYQAAVKFIETVNSKGVVPMGVHLVFRGFGPGRTQAFRGLRTAGWSFARLTDDTPIRYGGCRARKKRRI
jgi:small subunit ribosomal protein S11